MSTIYEQINKFKRQINYLNNELTTANQIKPSNLISTDFEITTPEKGYILSSPNGNRFRITIDDEGILKITNIESDLKI